MHQTGLLAFATITLVASGTGLAQDYPTRPVRVVTSAPGGGVDFTARLLAQGLTAALSQQFVVDNRGGTHVSSMTVANAAPDGYTLLVQNNTLWVAPLLEKPAYTMAQLTPVVLASRSLNVLVVHPSLPVQSVKDLISLAKSRPGDLNYASGPLGAAPHLAGELFKHMAGVDIVHIPFKGVGLAVNDVIAGRVQLMFSSLGSTIQQVRAGRLRALAISRRSSSCTSPRDRA